MIRAQSLAMPLTAAIRVDSLELARRVIVIGCAGALIFAGQALPF